MTSEHTAALEAANNQKPNQDILAPISLGELVDKITILQIKTKNLQGMALKNAMTELNLLEGILKELPFGIDPILIERLKKSTKSSGK